MERGYCSKFKLLPGAVRCRQASRLDPTPRFGLASRTAVENFAQRFFRRTLCRKARHLHQTVRTGHDPDRPSDRAIPVVTRFDAFCQWHAVTPQCENKAATGHWFPFDLRNSSYLDVSAVAFPARASCSARPDGGNMRGRPSFAYILRQRRRR